MHFRPGGVEVAETHAGVAHGVERLPEFRNERLDHATVDAHAGVGGRRRLRRGRDAGGNRVKGERPRADRLGGDLDACDHHRVAVGPDAERALLQRLVVFDVKHLFVVVDVLQARADAAELHAVPSAVDVAPRGHQRLVALPRQAGARAGHEVFGGDVHRLAVAQQARIELRVVGIPAGGDRCVAVAGGVVAAHDGEVEVAGALIPAHAHAGVKLDAEIAAEDIFGPERGQGIGAFTVHVRPGRLAEETVDDLPAAAVQRPIEERFGEERVEDVVALHQRVAEVLKRHAGDTHLAPGQRCGEMGFGQQGVVTTQPDDVAFDAQREEAHLLLVESDLRHLPGRNGEGGVGAGAGGEDADQILFDADAAGAVGRVFGDAEVQLHTVDDGEADLDRAGEVTLEPG
ncbi:MAG: hypothetical protein BWX70_02587 [Verrucomicrobia bacterium ADurb.Bin070]|nr:MAG: hypothetical protein BWX70_02587 [Verrucomicrobia bacterium ADurb.Bin070]